MIAVRVGLARAWGCSPVALRELTLGELVEMGLVLDAEERRRR
jgi:hypothetical protein